jgi:hypothetical protein
MRFNGLLPLAKKLASAPLESAKTFKVYEQLYRLKANELPQEQRLDQANTICDLNACVVMMIAAGITRIEAMKAAVSTGQAYESAAAGGRDRAWCFRRNAGAQFEQAMIDWCQLPGNGVVQFKFFPVKGVHTFAVERVPLTDVRDQNSKGTNLPRFRVYQAYESVYRLSDFLRTAGDENNYLKLNLDSYFEMIKPLKGRKFQYKSTKLQAQEKRQSDIARGVKSFDEVTRNLGGGRALIWSEFEQYVLTPLKEMLNGELPSADYSALTGVPENPHYRSMSINKLLVLMCDRVDPGEFAKNYEALPSQNVSPFVDFPQN